MPDEPQPVVADPTPAPDTALAPTDASNYAEWRTTGKQPEPKAASTTAKESSAGDKPAEKIAPASEAGTHKQERSDAETRLSKLLADLKTAGLTPKELETFKREPTTRYTNPEPKAGETDAKPAPSPAPPEQPGLKPPVKPDFRNWTGTWEEREAAIEKYHEENAAYQAAKAVRDDRAQQAQAAQDRDLAGKIGDANTRYGGDAGARIVTTAQAIFGKPGEGMQIPGAVAAVIDGSPVIVDLLYTIGGDKPETLAEFVALAKANPGAALRKVVLMEQLVSDELAKGKAAPAKEPAAGETAGRDEGGRFIPVKPKASQAPAPPEEVSGRAATPPDELASAANKDDFAAFKAKANARDIAHRRGQ
jgi:hypothetical protein